MPSLGFPPETMSATNCTKCGGFLPAYAIAEDIDPNLWCDCPFIQSKEIIEEED